MNLDGYLSNATRAWTDLLTVLSHPNSDSTAGDAGSCMKARIILLLLLLFYSRILNTGDV